MPSRFSALIGGVTVLSSVPQMLLTLLLHDLLAHTTTASALTLSSKNAIDVKRSESRAPPKNSADTEARKRLFKEPGEEGQEDLTANSKYDYAASMPHVPNCDCVSDCYAMLPPGMPDIASSYACQSGEHYPDHDVAEGAKSGPFEEMSLCAMLVSERLGTEHLTSMGQFCATHCKPPDNHCGVDGVHCDLGDRCVDLKPASAGKK
ncbi:unnamed protein product [Amoebophrya sp. A120]|nr:unnamed protein product [Amoebophrya sp. A120]|eukprot:GSA120T00008460001.1